MRGNVDTIKERLDIVEVLSPYLKLEKAGTNYKARCPFHNEKTPSFFVSPSRQSYYCFGCGAKGDMFTFVEEIEGVDFRGALKILADKAGVELEYSRPETKTEKDKLEHALLTATLFFQAELEKNKEALDYLYSRGLNDESIKEWKIGYAPLEWRSLYEYLRSIGIEKEIILKAGLAKFSPEKSDRDPEPYDVFRGRIMFPLADYAGRIIAFSGRALAKDTVPKYLNTPDTVLFRKSEILYGLDKAKEEIRRKDYTILVEGQLDLVLSHQGGVKNTVASSGTAFTQEQLERLKRLSTRIILAFDGDEAGEKAALRSTILGLSLGMEVKFANLPKGSDPAELVQNNPDEWKNVLRKSIPSIEHFLNRVMESEPDKRKQGKLIEKKILPLIVLLSSSIERSHFVSLISKSTGLREEVVWEDLRKVKSPEVEVREQAQESEIKKIIPRKTNIERRLIGIIFWQENLDHPTLDVSSLRGEVLKKVGDEYFTSLIESLSIEREALIFEAESHYSDQEKLNREVVELLDNLSDDLLREKHAKLLALLAKAERERDEGSIHRLSEEIQALLLERRELEEKKNLV